MGLVTVTDHVFANLDVERELLAAAGHELRYEGDAHTPEEAAAAAAGSDGVLNCYAPMPADVVRTLDRCRVIARYGIGLDTVDVDAASAKGIVVTNVPDYCIDEVSDHALALLLSVARGIVRLDRSVQAGSWDPKQARPLHRLHGRTLGLVGFGRIARSVAAKASGFGLRVMATDPYVTTDAIQAAGFVSGSLEEVLAGSDFVSLHAPLTAETRHLIGANVIAAMKPGAVLVNTSRGPLVDVAALAAALDSGALGGAALDVLEVEPPGADHPLIGRPNVVLTPHAAFYSEESMAELQRKAAEQVVSALAGEVPRYAVNADAASGSR